VEDDWADLDHPKVKVTVTVNRTLDLDLVLNVFNGDHFYSRCTMTLHCKFVF
jgi:hypothetical protein